MGNRERGDITIYTEEWRNEKGVITKQLTMRCNMHQMQFSMIHLSVFALLIQPLFAMGFSLNVHST